ncbi:hypothetical protein [Methylophilus sp. UBA6697]|jgi:hypothetical protein|uniref:hypothetical protein n=1 Tax=Methylophilus sp. UBA6697 TaxID=1946902 RepID=UPI000EEBFCD1|nr:hypothetical protein [Methylophilus sp. UBA6697]HCU84860.1 ADP-ribosyl-(dinitrogen reductase) hydrolase [Methylophilus sp.]
MISIVISPDIAEKLENKHNVCRREIEQCFENRYGNFLEDTREEHKTDPATQWFVSPTNCDRKLKVVFVFNNGNIYIKSAYEVNEKTIELYERHCFK